MDTLFHYTTAAGLLGILRESKLWATDLRFLNDAQEAVYALDAVVDAVRTMENPVRDPGHFAHKYGDPAIETFSRYQAMVLDELPTPEVGVYVTCFCELGDMLSQWRGYGKDHGYALEITTAGLERALEESAIPRYARATGLFKVQYGREAAASIVESAVQEVAGFNLNHPGVKAHHAADVLNSLLAQVKHPGFSEEQEWRLVVGVDILDETRHPIAVGEPTLYRSTPMAIVPYIELPLDRDSIVSVRVGPGGNVAVRETGVQRLLKNLGCTASVTRSDVPLRS
jgi:hypothetical protein